MTATLAAGLLLGELEVILRNELSAVAAVDTAEIERLAEPKRQVLAHLDRLGDGWRRDPDLTATLIRVRAQAEANARLLGYAANTCADLLGLRLSSGTYDSHARVAHAVTAFTRRAC